MSSPFDKYPFVKKELLKVFVAVFALTMASVAYYFYMRKDALVLSQKRAEVTLRGTEKMILARMGKVETAVNAIQPLVEYALDSPDDMFEIARHTVESSSRIIGAGISFKADYYPEKGHWYEAYVGYQNGDDTMVAKQLGSAEHDYLQMDWFKKGLASEEGFWSNPYYDNAGGKTRMVSYVVPFFDSTGAAIGVIVADVSFDTLANIVRGMVPYPHSYCTLVAGDGTVLVEPLVTAREIGKCHVFSENIDGKNMTLSITIPDSEMYSRLRRSSVFFGIMALTGILSVVFIASRLVRNLLKLNEVQIKEQRIEDELAIARNIQAALLPSAPLTDSTRNIDVSGLQVPAKFVGGDLFDYYVRDGKMLFCVGDVSGKGVPAALLMAIAHSLFRVLSAHNDLPERIMADLNTAICDNNPDMMFITMFLGIIDLETGAVRFCNAGHNPPILIQDGKAECLSAEPSLLLGVEPSAEYAIHELVLLPGSSLFLYTDGLTEAENVGKELFGEQRALSTAAGFGGLSAKEQIGRMRASVHQFVDGAEQSDDLTLLSIRFMKEGCKLCLSNDIEELNKLEPFLNDFFEREDLDKSILPQLDLALEEALTNVIMYAYPENEKGMAELTLEVVDGRIGATLTDNGTPFNPLQCEEANLDVSLEERQIGGLGIHLIKEIMDEVEYVHEEGRNVLRLWKNIEE